MDTHQQTIIFQGTLRIALGFKPLGDGAKNPRMKLARGAIRLNGQL